MAREATARLYDVDDNSVKCKKPKVSGKYDHGTITFRAKRGRLIDLDKLHESVWATRLSSSTRSGLVRLDVTVIGNVVYRQGEMILRVKDSGQHFVLVENVEEEAGKPADKVRNAIERGEEIVRVTGRLQGWEGRWPDFLKRRPAKPRRIKVASFQTAEEE